MKIYIKDYKPTDILKKIKSIDEYFCNTKNSIELISDEGNFYIDDKKFYKINIISDELVKLRSNNFDLLMDKSVYKNDIVHQVPLVHIESYVTAFYYAVNLKSKIRLVIEGNYDVIYNEITDNKVFDKNKIIINKYHNFSPINFFFEAPNEKTAFELLNNDDLNVFLSLLN
jgi:hypothetical protein